MSVGKRCDCGASPADGVTTFLSETGEITFGGGGGGVVVPYTGKFGSGEGMAGHSKNAGYSPAYDLQPGVQPSAATHGPVYQLVAYAARLYAATPEGIFEVRGREMYRVEPIDPREPGNAEDKG